MATPRVPTVKFKLVTESAEDQGGQVNLRLAATGEQSEAEDKDAVIHVDGALVVLVSNPDGKFSFAPGHEYELSIRLTNPEAPAV